MDISDIYSFSPYMDHQTQLYLGHFGLESAYYLTKILQFKNQLLRFKVIL